MTGPVEPADGRTAGGPAAGGPSAVGPAAGGPAAGGSATGGPAVGNAAVGTASSAAVPALVGFARALRAAGVEAGPDRLHALLCAVEHLDPGRTADVYWAGRLCLCASPRDVSTYDAAFAAYFGGMPAPRRPRRTVMHLSLPVAVPGDVTDESRAPDDTDDTDDKDGARAATASRREVLRHRDLARLSPADREDVRRLLAALHPVGPVRQSRRRRPALRGPLDPRRTVRDMLRRGGEPDRLLRRDRVARPRRLVVLVDVSGSVAPYADSYLRLAHAACRRRRSTEVFTMGTRLTRVTRELGHPDPDAALRAAGEAVPDWSGGTRLGEQLKAFLDGWGQRGIARGAVVLVASDGWERGDTTLLAEQMARLHRLAHRVVWVSPHSGRDGFVPLVGGLNAALPWIDELAAGHTLQALEALVARLDAEAGRA